MLLEWSHVQDEERAQVSSRPVSDYALLSDCRSAALVSSVGSVDWLCLPRFDSPAVFARLLDDRAGHWSVQPSEPSRGTRRYLPGTLVLETTFRTGTGTVVLRDALALGRRERGHRLAADSPGVLLREATCTEGTVAMSVRFEPRPEFGLVHPLLSARDGVLRAEGGVQTLTLSTSVPLGVDGSSAYGEAILRAGERLTQALHCAPGWGPDTPPWSTRRIRRRLRGTAESWRSWSELHSSYTGPWRDQVAMSGRVLRALTYTPTGAIIAAATTSLPESVGGSRNWDYRYTWVRDASLTLQALATSACAKEEAEFFGFLTRAAATQLDRGADLQIMYGIGGEHDLSERTLGHLAGWRDSAPVRVGNDAWNQRQLDVYGELLDAAQQTLDKDVDLEPSVRAFLLQAAETAARRWNETDQGIWEVRGEGRHFLHSKLMCWVALDRAIAMAPALHAHDRVEHWRQTRERIREAILDRGWNQDLGSFTQTFGGTALDASALLLPIVGFLPGDDPRTRSTVLAVQAALAGPSGLVRRYLDDGLEGQEGCFLLCTFWLAQALALIGEIAAARDVFDAVLAHANDVGLLAEEADALTGDALGNFPQAFSHIGLINAARTIHDAENRTRSASVGSRS